VTHSWIKLSPTARNGVLKEKQGEKSDEYLYHYT
jgi:hypothetical protein